MRREPVTVTFSDGTCADACTRSPALFCASMVPPLGAWPRLTEVAAAGRQERMKMTADNLQRIGGSRLTNSRDNSLFGADRRETAAQRVPPDEGPIGPTSRDRHGQSTCPAEGRASQLAIPLAVRGP